MAIVDCPGLHVLVEWTREHGSMLVVDSIQAGLRAHGVLSIVDYPGFGEHDEPDMESYSKALNAGQFPLSVLALSGMAAANYRQGRPAAWPGAARLLAGNSCLVVR